MSCCLLNTVIPMDSAVLPDLMYVARELPHMSYIRGRKEVNSQEFMCCRGKF